MSANIAGPPPTRALTGAPSTAAGMTSPRRSRTACAASLPVPSVSTASLSSPKSPWSLRSKPAREKRPSASAAVFDPLHRRRDPRVAEFAVDGHQDR